MDRVPESLNRRFYEQQRLLTLDDPPYPDSLYAVSKLFGENLGRYLVTTANIQFVASASGGSCPKTTQASRKAPFPKTTCGPCSQQTRLCRSLYQGHRGRRTVPAGLRDQPQ